VEDIKREHVPPGLLEVGLDEVIESGEERPGREYTAEVILKMAAAIAIANRAP
jgi:hypothetical protein